MAFSFLFRMEMMKTTKSLQLSEIIAADIKATVRGGDFSVIIFF